MYVNSFLKHDYTSYLLRLCDYSQTSGLETSTNYRFTLIIMLTQFYISKHVVVIYESLKFTMGYILLDPRNIEKSQFK